MPYKSPVQMSNGKWVLPKAGGGYNRTEGGKMVYYDSKEKAEAAARAIMVKEGGT